MSERKLPKSERMHEKAALSMPDLAAREPAEGDLDLVGQTPHLRYPNQELSSSIPVESGALDMEES
ncbi:MAG: hypothetical protein GX774_19880 [Armatimonadetes bacterium]|nr:hypothetical protein [Armatimonadota bacterium]